MSAWQAVPRSFEGETAVVLATGPSLSAEQMAVVADADVRVFGMNNLYHDMALDVHVACDPRWWIEYGDDLGDYWRHKSVCETWTWDEETHRLYPFTRLVRGRWGDGLSVDPLYIHYGHSSSYQCLNLAVLYGCARILLLGFDMFYPRGTRRHYFSKLSSEPGEYPLALRKHSTFTGLLAGFATIAAQRGLPPIINCTPGGALNCFPRGNLDQEIGR